LTALLSSNFNFVPNRYAFYSKKNLVKIIFIFFLFTQQIYLHTTDKKGTLLNKKSLFSIGYINDPSI
jgi:hypothetical protein